MESRILTVVVARFRPQNATEVKENGGQQIVEFDSEDSVKIDSREARCSFTFDRVFDTHCRQGEVFDYSIKSTVEDILNGYNGTVFAYGQTGSGKSFTMMGPDIDDSALKGIVPRIVEQIFASILSSPDTIEYTVRVSYMEIYMERIRDLLNPANDNLPVHEEKNRGVYVKGLLEIYVSSVQEVYEVMRTGGMARAVAATNMNQESSRSHSIFVVNVTQKNLETGSAKSGQLFLVDLAGSEKVGKSGASGQTLEEAKKINKSLSALGMVINSLTDGKSTHIPYRDSKLTRILQESLGGNSRTTLIICCSPASYNDAETMSTLRFGTRAKSIRNKATINAEMSPAELKAQLKKAQARILVFETYAQSLEGELNSWRRGETIAADKWVTSNAVRGRSPVRIDKLEGGRSTPGLERDERDEFLKRENGLQDSLADREGKLLEHEAALQAARDEITTLRSRHIEKASDCERLAGEIEELRLQLQRVSFEEQEASIIMDSLRDSNAELTAQLEEVKASLANARIYSAEGTTKQKAERLADSLSGVEGMGEQVLEEVVDIVRTMEGIPATDKERLQSKLLSAQALWRRQDRDDQPPTELNMLKKSLMRDLQNRCERVVELEMSLDQAREQYHLLIKTSSTKTQQKRMTLLERNLEQLTHVQRQLVDQNSSLKKQVAIAERKLSARTERVCLLERKLNDNEEKLAAADHRFHAQFSAVKDRLEAAQRWKGPDMDGTAFANGLGRIAKPLRGGEKRASWFGR